MIHDNENKTTIVIDEDLAYKLSVYRYKNTLSSTRAALIHLLENAEKARVPKGESSDDDGARITFRVNDNGSERDVDAAAFKRVLLNVRRATLRLTRSDGTTHPVEWKAPKVGKNSDIVMNIRTNHRVRKWNKDRPNNPVRKIEAVVVQPQSSGGDF